MGPMGPMNLIGRLDLTRLHGDCDRSPEPNLRPSAVRSFSLRSLRSFAAIPDLLDVANGQPETANR